MEETLLTVSSKGQITLPVRLRNKLKLEPGRQLVLRKVTSDTITLGVKRSHRDFYGGLPGLWTKGGQTPEGYVRSLRDRDADL